MKNFTNFKMCKSIVFAFVFGLMAVFNSFGQTKTSITVYPGTWYYSTGYVNASYAKSYGEVHIGKPSLAVARRGFIDFETTSIPDNAVITDIFLQVWPFNPGGSNHNLEIHQIIGNPESTGGSTLWGDIADGTIFYDGYALANVEDMWIQITLNSSAETDLQNDLSSGSNFWAIGLYEYQDNDNNSQIYGYDNSGENP